jgi:hypothetical protein
MPLTGLYGPDIFCVHAGISPLISNQCVQNGVERFAGDIGFTVFSSMLEDLLDSCRGIYRKRVGTKISVRMGGTFPTIHGFARARGEAPGSVQYSNFRKLHNHIDKIKYYQI